MTPRHVSPYPPRGCRHCKLNIIEPLFGKEGCRCTLVPAKPVNSAIRPWCGAQGCQCCTLPKAAQGHCQLQVQTGCKYVRGRRCDVGPGSFFSRCIKGNSRQKECEGTPSIQLGFGRLSKTHRKGSLKRSLQ